jgi:epsin
MDKLKEAARQAADKLKEKVEEKMAKNPLEKALNEATSDVNWNASNKVLQEIADHTYSFGDFTEVMKHIWKRLSSERKNWRRILKTLSLIEYLIKNGSPRCIQEFRDEIYQIRTLQDFSHYEDGQDRGAAIREVSKRVVTLLNDEQKIDEERKKSQELRERLGGEMKAYGSGGSSYGGTGSGSFGSSNRYDGGFNSNKGFGSGTGSGQSKYAGGGSTTGFGSETSKGFGSDSHYDDTRKTGKWRVEKNDEPKASELEGYTVKTGTKYESPTAEKKEEKPAEKRAAPLLAGPGGNKVLQAPKGSKTVQQAQPQQDLLGGEDLLTGGNTAPPTNNTAGNGDLFGWDQPQQPAPTTNNNTNQGQWNWAEPTGNQTQTQPQAKPQPQAQPQANASPFDWGQPTQNTAPQNTQPQPTANLQNLYQQNQNQNQNQFGNWNNQQQNVNNLSNQLGGLNFGGNTQNQGGWGQQQQQATPAQNNAQGGFQWGQSQSTSAPSNNFNAQPQNKNDGFDDFQVAKSTGVAGTGKEYKNYSNTEKSIIDLSDLASEANKKKENKGKIDAIKNSNEGFLYSSKEDLDNFFIAPQSGNAGMQGGFNQGGMNMNMGMNQGMRQQQQGGMYPNQMGMNMGMQQQQQQMGMQGNFYGNQQGFNPMMGNPQGNFGNPQMNQGQMGGMNNGFRF